MPWSGEHIEWLVESTQKMKTEDGKEISVFEFHHDRDPLKISRWAKHFRNHYLLDSEIDAAKLANASRRDHLLNNVFPRSNTNLGPAIRAGDFAEILVADYLQYRLNHWVPRVRWAFKESPDKSPAGCDVIGFHFVSSEPSPSDLLTVVETKAKFSGSGKSSRLQDAVADSAKDQMRLAESLNAMRQKLRYRQDKEGMERVARFQNPADDPYREAFGAFAVYCNKHFDSTVANVSCTSIEQVKRGKTVKYNHPRMDVLFLAVIKGQEMMQLVNDLYRVAADEA